MAQDWTEAHGAEKGSLITAMLQLVRHGTPVSSYRYQWWMGLNVLVKQLKSGGHATNQVEVLKVALTQKMRGKQYFLFQLWPHQRQKDLHKRYISARTPKEQSTRSQIQDSLPDRFRRGAQEAITVLVTVERKRKRVVKHRDEERDRGREPLAGQDEPGTPNERVAQEPRPRKSVENKVH